MTDHSTSHSINADALGRISSFIERDVSMTGDLTSKNPDAGFALRGEFRGNIRFPAGGVIHVAAGADFSDGALEADYILVEGLVRGNIHARKCIEITSSAVVLGAVTYDADLDIHKNARIRASLTFTGDMDIVAAVTELADAEPAATAVADDAPVATVAAPEDVAVETAAEAAATVEAGEAEEVAEHPVRAANVVALPQVIGSNVSTPGASEPAKQAAAEIHASSIQPGAHQPYLAGANGFYAAVR